MNKQPINGEGPDIICSHCNVALTDRLVFRFGVAGNEDRPNGVVLKCLKCALCHWPMIKRSMKVAVVVGTVLALLNQGDLFLMGDLNNSMLWKLPLTYCVPFVVATYGALANIKGH